MARIILLFLFLLWMTGTTDLNPRPPEALGLCTALYLGFHLLLVGLMRLWSERVAGRVAAKDIGRSLDRLNIGSMVARLLVPAWFAVGLFALGWGTVVQERLGLGRLATTRLPGVLLGTLPPLLGWMGLWWSQYPAERAVREQSIQGQLGEDVPVHAPPSFRAYFFSNLRLQLLFTVVPVLLMILVRDGISVTITDHLPGMSGGHARAVAQATDRTAAPKDGAAAERSSVKSPADPDDGLAEVLCWVGSAGLVYLVAPAVLRRVLRTEPLRDGPLRRRLEALCKRSGVRYREILFWDTGHNMGNAAVMGVVPWMRYILLSDVLMETMTDDQIEAVFAHEVGHVVHRHMVWFVIFFGALFTGICCVEKLVENVRWLNESTMVVIGSLVCWSAVFWLGLGFLSRRFERQADVFAARTIQSARGAGHSLVELVQPAYGAEVPQDALPAGAVAASFAYAYASVGAGAAAGAGAPGGGATGFSFFRGRRAAGERSRRERGSTYVGHYGASLFGSALHRVAKVNNIPIAKHEWLHGSIAKRMQYLREMSTDPAHTSRFDRVMARLYCGLLFALIACAVWLWAVHCTDGRGALF